MARVEEDRVDRVETRRVRAAGRVHAAVTAAEEAGTTAAGVGTTEAAEAIEAVVETTAVEAAAIEAAISAAPSEILVPPEGKMAA